MGDSNKKIKRKVRNAYIISTISVAMVLFLLGSIGYLILGALGATERLQENVTIHVMLDRDIQPDEIAPIRQKLEGLTAVKSVVFISKDEAAEDFKHHIDDDFVEFLDFNPLPDSFELKLDAAASEKEQLTVLDKEVSGWNGVEEVVYQRNVIEQFNANINKFKLILLLFGVTLLFISLILLNNTIRITIFSKRYIINTMKLVGATRGFIMKPFLGSSILQGIYASLIAWAMLLLMLMGLNEGLPEIHLIGNQTYLLVIFGAMMVGGIAISLIFTTFAVRKFLRMNSSNIHIY